MIAATSGPSAARTASADTVPSALAGTERTEKPISAAVAGLVPWALSGTSTTVAARIVIMPQSSP
jgi:hypothetical protein